MSSGNVPAVPKEKSVNPEVWRELSTHTVLFHHAVGERLGLGPADHKCLDLVLRATTDAPMTPGRLAELTGLTTGAITGVLDRLEEAGFVRREKDNADRRQVIIRLLPQRLGELAAIFEPFAERFKALASDFTPQEISRFEEFARRNVALLQSEIVRLRAERSRTDAAEIASSPLGHLREGRLEITRGAANLLIASCEGDELYRARFEGPTPTIKAERGHVTLTYVAKLSDLLRFRRSSGRLELNRTVPWNIRVRGGASATEADFRAIRLIELDVSGGLSEVTMRFGPPAGVVPIRLRGGAEKLRIIRPSNVATRIVVKGGISGLAIDTMRLGSVGGSAEWQSPDYETAESRYDIDLAGGANKLGLEIG